MSEEILINVTLMETRVALIENGLLQEVFIERHNKRGHVGDIFRGQVVRVMPGMEAAFVDIGLERAAFIHNSDIVAIDAEGLEVRDELPRPIQETLREGQDMVVQVAKDAISSKGNRLFSWPAVETEQSFCVIEESKNSVLKSISPEKSSSPMSSIGRIALKLETCPFSCMSIIISKIFY